MFGLYSVKYFTSLFISAQLYPALDRTLNLTPHFYSADLLIGQNSSFYSNSKYSSFHHHWVLILSKTCQFHFSDVDECTLNLHNCHEQATCTNTLGSYSCACNTGWTGDGYICEGTFVEQSFFISFLCSFLLITRTKTSTYASDVNECTLNLHNCHEQATCANTLGSYSCACNSGWTGNGLTCEGNWKTLAGQDFSHCTTPFS